MTRSHLIGSGGGNRGSLHPLIYEWLADRTEIVGYDGSSISAAHGYAVTTDNVDHIRPMWEGIRQQSDFMRKTWLTPVNGLHTLEPLRKLLAEQRWGRPHFDFGVGIFDWQRAEHRIVNLRGRPLWKVLDYVIASCSIMAIHDRVTVGGRLVGDGGHHSPIPVRPFGADDDWLDGIDEVHVLLCRPLEGLPVVDAHETDGPLEMLMRFIDYATHQALLRSLAVLRQWAQSRRDIAFWVYAPRDWDITGPTFESNDRRLRRQIADRIAHGRWMLAHRKRLT